QECEHGLFLHNIGMEMLTELHTRPAIHVNMQDEEICKEREDMILRIQKLADNYYRSVWNHLNAEEQFVLYDLAQDGLVNSKNLDIVAILIDKGLLIDSTKLHIMNRNFRNFVLSIVDPADLGKLEKSLNTTGNWSRFKLPLFFVVFTLLLFVLKSDSSPLFSSITGFTAIIPIAVAILSLFSQVKKKE
ncbi:MAG TPA: hypothetical protein VK826_15555, partial [Bacteroidia bacterium]|nr:hypothetical protein [Bacteroidia bacterium]